MRHEGSGRCRSWWPHADSSPIVRQRRDATIDPGPGPGDESAPARYLHGAPITSFETPIPPARTRWPAPYSFEEYAQVMRDVAAAKGIPVIDTFAFAHTVDNWSDLYSDGAHPGDEMYRLIATHALYPALLPWVASRLCEKAAP